MEGLVSCPTCQKEISKTALACPHCGHDFSKEMPYPNSSLLGFFLGSLIIPLIGIIAGIWGLIKGYRNAGRVLLFGVFWMFILSAIFGYFSVKHEIQNQVITTESTSPPIITMEKYNFIKTGDSYWTVQDIIGVDGVEQSSTSLNGYTSATYCWTNPDGSSMIAIFANGKLESKAQFGLH